jgi:hypothetical protein
MLSADDFSAGETESGGPGDAREQQGGGVTTLHSQTSDRYDHAAPPRTATTQPWHHTRPHQRRDGITYNTAWAREDGTLEGKAAGACAQGSKRR